MDLFPCLGTPLVATMPHFYNADPSFAEAIATPMTPEKEKHQIYIDMETVPLYCFGRNKISVNIFYYRYPELLCRLPKGCR